MNMKVIYFNRSKKNIKGLEEAKQVSLDELFSSSDIISLNCPLTPETKEIINAESLKKIKKTSIVINTGRGPLINEKDAAEALKEKRLAGLACDVLSVEPPAKDNPLLKAPNCIITPHIAWQTFEARERLIKTAAANVKAFIAGKEINRVN